MYVCVHDLWHMMGWEVEGAQHIIIINISYGFCD